MKKYYKLMSSLITIISMLIGFQSCSPLLKHAIDKKYPPVDIIDKKIQSVCKSKQMLDNTTKFDFEADISQNLVNEISDTYLKKSNTFAINQNPNLKTIKVLAFNVTMQNQEIGFESREVFELNNKYIRSVELELFAATSPYFEGDNLYLNPYFNRIKIKKIEFNKCPLFISFKLLKGILNGVLTTYLANINGQVKNYSIRLKPTPGGTKKMSELISTSTPLVIEKDADIDWKSYAINASILIHNAQLRVVASLDDSQMVIDSVCTSCTKCSRRQKRKFFETKFFELKNIWEVKSKENFDDIDISNSYLTIKSKTEFLETAFNETFSNLDFRYKYPVSFNTTVPNIKIKIGKPSIDCSCSHFCGGIGNWFARQVCYASCYAGTLGRVVVCNGARLALDAVYAPFGGSQLPIGDFGGKLDGSGDIHGTFAGLSSTNGFSTISINHSHSFDGSVHHEFDFNGLTGIGILVCPHLFIHGNSGVNAAINNPLVSDITKSNDASGVCRLTITPRPTIINIGLSQSPALNIFTDLRNNFTCNLSVLGFGGFVWSMVSLIKNDQEAKNAINAAITGKYDYEYQVKGIEFPMKYQFKLDNKEINLNSYWGTKSLNATVTKDDPSKIK